MNWQMLIGICKKSTRRRIDWENIEEFLTNFYYFHFTFKNVCAIILVGVLGEYVPRT